MCIHMAFVRATEPGYKFPLAYHVPLRNWTDVAMNVSVFKWQAAQVVNSMAISRMPTVTDEHVLKMSLLLVSCDRLIATQLPYRYKEIVTKRRFSLVQ